MILGYWVLGMKKKILCSHQSLEIDYRLSLILLDVKSWPSQDFKCDCCLNYVYFPVFTKDQCEFYTIQGWKGISWLIDKLPGHQIYTYIFLDNAQTLDHFWVSSKPRPIPSSLHPTPYTLFVTLFLAILILLNLLCLKFNWIPLEPTKLPSLMIALLK